MWVPDHLALNCFRCNVDFSWPVVSVHHCRNCGQAFCAACSNWATKLEMFGYVKPVRVCTDCKESLQRERAAIRNNLDQNKAIRIKNIKS